MSVTYYPAASIVDDVSATLESMITRIGRVKDAIFSDDPPVAAVSVDPPPSAEENEPLGEDSADQLVAALKSTCKDLLSYYVDHQSAITSNHPSSAHLLDILERIFLHKLKCPLRSVSPVLMLLKPPIRA